MESSSNSLRNFWEPLLGSHISSSKSPANAVSEHHEDVQLHSMHADDVKHNVAITTSKFDDETDGPDLRSWPGSPTTFGKWSVFSVLSAAGEVVLAVAPLCFIMLGIAVAVLHQQPTDKSRFGARVQEATRLGPTIFPILFAAIAGRSMKMIARHRAEKGATLGSLELLVASQSVWGTIESQISMRRLTTFGASLIVLWSLSPLGGQASLRVLSIQHQGQSRQIKLRYLDTGPAGTIWPNEAVNGRGLTGVVGTLFNAALIAPDSIKTTSQDLWGNVKVPRLEALNASHMDNQGWMQIPADVATEDYSSLVGLPVVGRPQNASAEFELESSYMSLRCTAPIKVPYAEDFWDHHVGQFWAARTIISGPNPFTPFPTMKPTGNLAGTILPTWFLETYSEFDNRQRMEKYFGLSNNTRTPDPQNNFTRYITLGSVAPPPANWQNDSAYTSVKTRSFGSIVAVALVNCSLGETRVETTFSCKRKQCAASKMRRSVLDTRSPHLTAVDLSKVADNLFFSLPLTGGSQAYVIDESEISLVPSPPEVFINDTAMTSYGESLVRTDGEVVDLSTVSAEAFERRLGIILNTYHQLSTYPGSFIGNQQPDLSLYGPDTTPVDTINTWFGTNATFNTLFFSHGKDTFGSANLTYLSSERMEAYNNAPFIAATTTSTVTDYQEIYVCDFFWLALLIGSSCVLLATGLTSAILKQRTLAPDMIGYVASMTYENPYVKVPNGHGGLDAAKRARLLKDVPVRIGDVRGNAPAGHVAFTMGWETRKLERSREYV